MKTLLTLCLLSFGLAHVFAQAPTITFVSPTVGAPGVSVTISGTGFTGTTQNTFVRFGTALASVTSVQQGTIVTQAPGNATFGPVTVTTSGRTAVSRNSFFVRTGSGGLGTSSYQQPVPLGAVSANSQTIALADIDGDRKLDVILPQTSGNTVRVARNATPTGGTFTFDAQVDIPTTWFGARGVATGDMDGDGKLDVVIACTGAASPGRVAVLRNTSTSGTINASSFGASVLFRDTTSGLFIPNDVAVGDFDSDGRPDIAAAGQITAGNNDLFIFRNVSSVGSITTNSFEHPVRFAAGTAARRVRVADVDGDGKCCGHYAGRFRRRCIGVPQHDDRHDHNVCRAGESDLALYRRVRIGGR